VFRLKVATDSDPFWQPCRSEATLVFFYFTDVSASVKFLFLSHGFSFQLNSVSVMNQSV
jgi:hypothetical protein